MVNNNQQQQMPDPRQLLIAPMTVLDAQAKAFSEGLTNMLNMGNASLSTMFSTLQAPLAQPTEPIQQMVLAPLNMARQLAAPLMAGVSGAPPPPPAGQGETPATEPAAYEAPPTGDAVQRGNVVEGVGGIFNIVRPD